MPDEIEDTVRTLVAEAGLNPSDEEISTLVAGYPALKSGVESLYAVAEARYAAPALVFSATPVFAEWDG
jgi:hypothetical protein